MEIQEYTPQYQDDVLAMITHIQKEEFNLPIRAEDQPDLHAIESFYQWGNGNFWVALHDERVVGCIALLDISNRSVALRKMFVKKEFRGAAYGIANDLIKCSESWSKDRAVETIYLGTINVFHAALKFYQKQGFSVVDKHQLPETFPFVFVDNVFYKKHILI